MRHWCQLWCQDAIGGLVSFYRKIEWLIGVLGAKLWLCLIVFQVSRTWRLESLYKPSIVIWKDSGLRKSRLTRWSRLELGMTSDVFCIGCGNTARQPPVTVWFYNWPPSFKTQHWAIALLLKCGRITKVKGYKLLMWYGRHWLARFSTYILLCTVSSGSLVWNVFKLYHTMASDQVGSNQGSLAVYETSLL